MGQLSPSPFSYPQQGGGGGTDFPFPSADALFVLPFPPTEANDDTTGGKGSKWRFISSEAKSGSGLPLPTCPSRRRQKKGILP